MSATKDHEEQAIRKLVAQIDALDAWRDRPGRIVIYLFLATFLGSVSLLVFTVTHAHPAVNRGAPAASSPAP
jgi:hypothetical protein